MPLLQHYPNIAGQAWTPYHFNALGEITRGTGRAYGKNTAYSDCPAAIGRLCRYRKPQHTYRGRR